MHAVTEKTLRQEIRERYESAQLIWGEYATTHHKTGKGAIPEVKNFVHVLRFIKAHEVLDYGCGSGRHSILLAEEGFHVVAAEFVPKAVELLKDKIAEKNLGDIIEPVLLDARKPSLAERKFDAVICLGMLDLVTKKEARETVDNIWRMMKPGGALLVRVGSDKTKAPIQNWKGVEVKDEKGTFVSDVYEEKFGRDIIRVYHMFSEKELKELFKDFDIKRIELVEGKDKRYYTYSLVAEKKEAPE